MSSFPPPPFLLLVLLVLVRLLFHLDRLVLVLFLFPRVDLLLLAARPRIPPFDVEQVSTTHTQLNELTLNDDMTAILPHYYNQCDAMGRNS